MKAPKSKFFYAAAGVSLFLIPAVLRLILGIFYGSQLFADQNLDDWLMLSYSGFRTHFHVPDPYSLVKYMGYPVLLAVCRVSKIPYSVLLSLLWIISSLFFSAAAYRVSKKRSIAYGSYLYFLFLPMAFEVWCGARVYRNAVIAPFTALIFSLAILLFTDLFEEPVKKGRTAFEAVALSLTFSLTYYLKEDSAWLLACLLFFILAAGVVLAVLRVKKRISMKSVIRKGLVFLAPLLAFIAVTLGYKAVNYHYFGVFETNTRNEGEPGEFAKLLYAVDSENRTASCWVPSDVLDQVFRESETLAEHPKLLESLKHDYYSSNGSFNGDYVTWGLRDALIETGLWKSEKETADFFGKVNEELRLAFREGRLKKSSRIQLLPSGGGRTLPEIFALSREVKEAFSGAVLLKGYISSYSHMDYGTELLERIHFSEKVLHLDFEDYGEVPAARAFAFRAADVLFWVYRVINVLLVLMVFAALATAVIRKIRKRKMGWKPLLLMLFFLGLSFLYSFAIGWFSSFLYPDEVNMTIHNFYNIALPVLLAFSYLFAATALFGKKEALCGSEPVTTCTGSSKEEN